MVLKPFANMPPASFWSPYHMPVSAWHEHAPFAFAIVQLLRPRILVELGTHLGFSYLTFCQAVQRCDLPTRCYAIDTWQGDDQAGFYGEEIFNQMQAMNQEFYSNFSSLLRCRFEEAVPYFADGEIDLLHIDGRHTYEDVVQDFTQWRPKLSERAVVLFHDTNVRRDNFGVWNFWRELCEQYPSFEFVHGNGLGVLGVGSHIPSDVRAFLESDSETAQELSSAYASLGAAITIRAQRDAIHQDAASRTKETDDLRKALTDRQAECHRLREELETNAARFIEADQETRAENKRLAQLLRTTQAESALNKENFRLLQNDLDQFRETLAATEHRLLEAVRDNTFRRLYAFFRGGS